MRSSVFDRFKKTGGLLTADDSSHGMKMGQPRSLTVAVAEKPAEPKGPSEFPPASEDEPAPEDPAEEGHHGTMEKPVDLVSGKLIIRLDDGQLYELKKLQNQGDGEETGGFGGGY